MIDTCFILNLLYDKDPKNAECILTLKRLLLSKCNLYITDIISAEILNQITKKLFLNDMRYRVDKIEPINTLSNINLIIACFNKHHRKIIKEKKFEKFNEIPFNKYFYNISKSQWKKDLLKVYFEKSVQMHSALEQIIKFKYLNIDRNCVELAKAFMEYYMLSINDSYHLACTEYYGIEYFLTLDCDFDENIQSKVKILKI